MNTKPAVPAVYIFGDSTFDVGTNHFLSDSKAQADKKRYGIDFPKSQPTGRFSNGYNTADKIAMHLGFEMSPPPFLLLFQNNTQHFRSQILKGVNFASGGSGILYETGKKHFNLRNLGARKFGILSVPPLGCVPMMRLPNKNRDCNEDLNAISQEFYTLLKGLLQNLSSQFPDMKYSLANSYNMSKTMINNAQILGLENLSSPCCGNLTSACTPDSEVCQNRNAFMFWDQMHPTQRVSELAAESLFIGGEDIVAPINFARLI
ncbi:hypothetical protein L6164_020224 [Bauhinia variegata]|uniref:Uncharacterized protein n=1 Tax=Bauhinia variegata TaxID=167791 RepID=A0ACB9MVS0_BAUVA|nr:hypothetical protein L6164_020224 [Bauhinia variegata]